MCEQLLSMWERNTAAADVDIDPESWAREIVDQNFV